MSNSQVSLEESEQRVDYNVRALVLGAFVRNGLEKFTKPETVVAMFFGEGDLISDKLREAEPLIFDTFKTPEQVRSWKGYSYELANKNPLAMILKLCGEREGWVTPPENATT